MNRPSHTWFLFAGCLTVLLAGMLWVSAAALRLDRAYATAQQRAGFEENFRLALWRMDSFLAPLIGQESSRPYFTYNSFYAADRAYPGAVGGPKKGETLVPSPLLMEQSTNVLLHFQLEPNGAITSPELPENGQTAHGFSISPERVKTAAVRLAQLRKMIQPKDLYVGCASNLPMPSVPALPAQQVFAGNSYAVAPAQMEQQQALRNAVEYQSRAQSIRQVASQNAISPLQLNEKVWEGIVKPVWLGNALVLARRVNIDGRNYIQGCWLDWTNIRQSLLDSVRDLAPGADLIPFKDQTNASHGELLASLPVRLVAPQAVENAVSPFWTPIRLSLAVAWSCVLLAAAAVAGLLSGTLRLSERRADFVSAVTHELRTPLTTFKMYSEMLAGGMVSDEEKKRSYLTTLCAEANRLSHLVENVLAYARLERGSARRRIEAIQISELVKQVEPRLRQRAGQVGASVVVEATPNALASVVYVDSSVVEQILFNLVDNACKYGVPAAGERTIHLEALSSGSSAMLRVRDHGAGISEEAARRLFKPFSKSAQDAAHSAPGVGLGLALCRRLSRAMGGELRWNAKVRDGACFELSLPIGAQAS